MNEAGERKENFWRISHRLLRPAEGRILGGVAEGIGLYFNIDSTIIRLIFVLLTVFSGSGIILYLLLWLVIPSESSLNSSEAIKENMHEIRSKARIFAHTSKNNPEASSFWAGIILLILGIFLLANNLGYLINISLIKLWPILLIALGFSILARKK